jgi:hypothetical protein
VKSTPETLERRGAIIEAMVVLRREEERLAADTAKFGNGPQLRRTTIKRLPFYFLSPRAGRSTLDQAGFLTVALGYQFNVRLEFLTKLNGIFRGHVVVHPVDDLIRLIKNL